MLDSAFSHVLGVDAGLMIAREAHVCAFKCDVMEERQRQYKRKNVFFAKSAKRVNRLFSHRLRAHLERNAYKIRSIPQLSTNALARHQALRTSLQHNNRLKRSVRKRHCVSEERSVTGDCQATLWRPAGAKFKSVSSSINDHYGCYDCGSDSDRTEEDSLGDIAMDYKLTMDKAFAVLNARMASRRSSIDKI